MSSLIINGMEIPNDCNTCPILQTGYLEHYCPLAKEVMYGTDIVRGRHRNCPLVEVSAPHGDLIDRNALLEHSQYLGMFDKYGEGTVVDVVDAVLDQDIENAPTIIEAEE